MQVRRIGGGESLRGPGIAAEHRHVQTIGHEPPGDGGPDAARAARHQGMPYGLFHHHPFPPAAAAIDFSRSKCASSCCLPERYCRGHSTAV